MLGFAFSFEIRKSIAINSFFLESNHKIYFSPLLNKLLSKIIFVLNRKRKSFHWNCSILKWFCNMTLATVQVFLVVCVERKLVVNRAAFVTFLTFTQVEIIKNVWSQVRTTKQRLKKNVCWITEIEQVEWRWFLGHGQPSEE